MRAGLGRFHEAERIPVLKYIKSLAVRNGKATAADWGDGTGSTCTGA
jgi:hypothetical protein